MPFDVMLRTAQDLKLLRVNSLRIGAGEERPYVSLGHDALAEVAYDWDEDLKRTARFRELLAGTAAIGAVALLMAGLAIWGFVASKRARAAEVAAITESNRARMAKAFADEEFKRAQAAKVAAIMESERARAAEVSADAESERARAAQADADKVAIQYKNLASEFRVATENAKDIVAKLEIASDTAKIESQKRSEVEKLLKQAQSQLNDVLNTPPREPSFDDVFRYRLSGAEFGVNEGEIVHVPDEAREALARLEALEALARRDPKDGRWQDAIAYLCTVNAAPLDSGFNSHREEAIRLLQTVQKNLADISRSRGESPRQDGKGPSPPPYAERIKVLDKLIGHLEQLNGGPGRRRSQTGPSNSFDEEPAPDF